MFKLIPLQISFGTWRRQQWHCKDRQWQWRKKKDSECSEGFTVVSLIWSALVHPGFLSTWVLPKHLRLRELQRFQAQNKSPRAHLFFSYHRVVQNLSFYIKRISFSSSSLDFFATFKFLHLTTRTSNFSRQTKRWLGNMKVGAENSSLLLQRWTKNSPQWISTPFW